MKSLFALLIGLVLLLVPVYAWITNFAEFGSAAVYVLKGGVMWGLLIVGLATLFSGFSGLKE